MPISLLEGIQAVPFGTTQTLAADNPAVNTTAFATDGIVRLSAVGACYYKIGASATAAATDSYLGAGAIDYRKVSGGQRVSAFASAATVLHVEFIAN